MVKIYTSTKMLDRANNSITTESKSGISRFATINDHEHTLILHFNDQDRKCNVCNISKFKAIYSCDQGCDYNCCITCANKLRILNVEF